MNEDKAPRHHPPKIVGGDPVREPINLQTALVMRRASWIHQPQPDNLGKEILELKKENADLKRQLQATRLQEAALQKKMAKMREQVEAGLQKVQRLIEAYEKRIDLLTGEERERSEKVLRKKKTLLKLLDA